MRTSDFDYDLPPDLIAQHPAPRRDASRLLVLHRDSGQIEHRDFRDLLEFLRPGDVLVLNDSRVIPARLRGANAHTGGQFEILLVEENAVNDWWVMLRPGKRARVGTHITLWGLHGQSTEIGATVIETNAAGHRRLCFTGTPNIVEALEALGEVPLPPYIARAAPSAAAQIESDLQRYQTVFAKSPGSVAAPTAGLHFTQELLEEIRSRGVQVRLLTLHVGLGTFAPVKTETLAAHTMHEERFNLSEETAGAINAAKHEGRRVFAVGSTTLRVLESVAAVPLAHQMREGSGVRLSVAFGAGKTRLFIYPPYAFKIVDALLTNFHLPCSTLLMLVSAFAAPKELWGRDLVLTAYAEAISRRYRFFSYGDAMLIL